MTAWRALKAKLSKDIKQTVDPICAKCVKSHIVPVLTCLHPSGRRPGTHILQQ